MLRSPFPWGVLLLALLTLSFAAHPAPPEAHTALHTADRSFILYVDYHQTSGALRKAWVTVRPVRGAPPVPWRGALTGVHLSLRGASTVPREARILMRRRSDGSFVGWGLVPDPRRIERLMLRGEDGRLVAFRVPQVSAHGGDDDPPPQEPPGDPPPDDDPPEGDDCRIPSGCEVINPWTCECEVGLEDPWGDSAVMTGPTQLALGI